MRKTFLLLVLGLSGTLLSAQAVRPGSFTFAFQLGTNFPEGKLGERADYGWTSSFDFTYNVNERFGLRTEFGYSDNWIDLKSPVAAALDINASHYNWNISENAVFFLNRGPVSVYLIGGIGGYRTTLSLDQTVPVGYWDPWWGYWYGYGTATVASDTTTKIGYNAGIGVSFRTGSQVSIFLESRYTQIQTKTTIDYIPLTVGIRW